LASRINIETFMAALVVTLVATGAVAAGAIAGTPDEARQAFDQGRVDDAIKMCSDAIATKTDLDTETSCLDVLVRSYIQKEDFTKAYEYVGRLTVLDMRARRKVPEHRFLASLVLYRLGRAEPGMPERNVAVTGVMMALESDPGNPAYLDLAKKMGVGAAGESGPTTATVECTTTESASQAVEKRKAEARETFDKAGAAYDKQEFAVALPLLNKAIELDPGLSEAWKLRAVIKYMTQDLRGALIDYTKAIELSPGDDVLYYGRAMLKRDLHMESAAIPDIEQAIKLVPDDFLYFELRGILRGLTGDAKGALEDFTMEVKLAPKEFAAWFNRGAQFLAMKEYGMALVDATQALNLEPDNGQVYWLVGECHMKLGNRDKAIDFYTKGAERGDERSKAALEKLRNN